MPKRGVATSGDYRNFYIKDGKKYAHTINPATGYPAGQNILSATIVAEDCMTADAYATTFMVLGVEKAKLLAQSIPKIEYFIIYADNNGQQKVTYSKGMLEYLPNRKNIGYPRKSLSSYMKRYLNQLECKILRAGDSLFNTTTTDNLLIFVFSGKLIIYSQEGTHIAEVAKDHFMLLAQNTNHKVIASAPTRLILIHAGSLSDMIINDPEWNVEKPVVLPIPPALAHTLNQIEYYMKDKYFTLN